MRRCPKCHREYSDDSLNFCLDDGEWLNEISDQRSQTAVLSDPIHSSEAPTRYINHATAESTVAETVQEQPAKNGDVQVPSHRLRWLIGIPALLIVAAGLIGYRYMSKPTGNRIASIAVLPFENISGNPNMDYLSDGLSESLIYRLSQISTLKVSPRSSVFRYKGNVSDPITTGSQLGVDGIVTGRIVQHGENLAISVELNDVKSNKLIWGEQYERKMSDLLSTQREIAGEITRKLEIKLSTDESRQADKHYTENNEAYQNYLKGRFYWNKRTRDGYRAAIEYFNAAINKDPTFALAYAGLADCYNIFGSYGISAPTESFPLAKAAATKALELDDNLAEAHTSFAYIKYQFEWDWNGAEVEFKRAIDLNPNYALAHSWYGIELAGMGRMEESLREMKRSEELDPLSSSINASEAWMLYQARRYDEAITQFQKALDLDQSFARAHWGIAEPYLLKGNYDKAISEFQASRQLDETPLILARLGHAYAVSGRKPEAREILANLKQLPKPVYVDHYFIAEIHLALGEREQALNELENAYKERSSWMVWLKVDPLLDDLRPDPRFQDLMRHAGLLQ